MNFEARITRLQTVVHFTQGGGRPIRMHASICGLVACVGGIGDSASSTRQGKDQLPLEEVIGGGQSIFRGEDLFWVVGSRTLRGFSNQN